MVDPPSEAEVKEVLLHKHHPKQTGISEAIMTSDVPAPDLHPVLLDIIDGSLI